MHALNISEDSVERRQLLANTRQFSSLIDAFNAIPDRPIKYDIALNLLEYAVAVGHCYWSSPSLEKYFCSVAKKIDATLEPFFVPNSCLLVVTQAYEYGGMERVLERWIETDPNWHYSIAFTRMDNLPCPKRIATAVEKSGGKIIKLCLGGDLRQRAMELRRLGSGFEAVVIIAYETDPVSLMAFGTEAFKRPVGMYNQCDHRFGINVSISDLVGQLRDWGLKISERHRGIRESVVVSVPAEVRDIPIVAKADARRILGLSCDAKVVLSVGRVDKYRPVAGMDFKDIASALLDRDDRIVVVVVGPKEEEVKNWRPVLAKYGNRFMVKGTVDHEDLYNYFFAADVALDSYPTGGIAASSDAIMCGCPILTVEETTDFLTMGGASCASECELVDRTIALLNDGVEQRKLVESVRRAIEETCGKDVFVTNRNRFMELLRTKKHCVKSFSTTPTDCILADCWKLTIFLSWAEQTQKSLRPLLVRPVWLGVLLWRIQRRIKQWFFLPLSVIRSVRYRGLAGFIGHVWSKLLKNGVGVNAK